MGIVNVYGLNDISIIPAEKTDIEHRSECVVHDSCGMLPLFTAPMNSVINEDNYDKFVENKINTIIPRGVDFETRWNLSTKTFVAVGLDEFKEFAERFASIYDNTHPVVRYVCIDIANGHMTKLFDLCKHYKSKFGERLIIMAGNIANAKTYWYYKEAHIDYVRVSVGSGSVCTTSCNTAIHNGMASLIMNIYKMKQEQVQLEDQFAPKIVADGGFDSYDKIIKALALGADYVMIGKLFAQAEEACGEVVNSSEYFNPYTNKIEWERSRIYYGMSTKRAQKENGNSSLKTSEGIQIKVPIKYTLKGWTENFVDYLRSAMSYTNSRTLEQFVDSDKVILSPAEFYSYYK